MDQAWSIRAELAGIIERAVVKQVETNGNGEPVAFVRIYAGPENADSTVDEWITFRQYDWDNGGWKEWPS
ncbi:hypothetical protein ACFVDH_24470 [Streptomyces sp. NPDC057674]|uniref:hypothetical protein n=1 Tax=Streptomyces sp. NPDC057674 TaxID=3346203 RepID=UPI0036B306A3